MGQLLRQYWVPAALSSELPEPEARRCACACSARTSSRTARPRTRWADPEQLPAPRRQPVLRPQRGGGAARASITAGSSASTARLHGHAERAGRDRLQAQGARDRLPVRRARRPGVGVPGTARHNRRPCPSSRPRCWRTCRSRPTSASATGSRRWRATSTPATRCSCTSAASIPRTSPRGRGRSTCSPIRPRTTRWPTRTSA
jgi:hypothetical protein